MKYLSTLLVLSIALLSCQNSAPKEGNKLAQLEQTLKDNPSSENAMAVVKEIGDQLSQIKNDPDQMKPLLLKGLNISKNNKLGGSMVNFLMPLIRKFPHDEETTSRLLDLSSLMRTGQKNHISDVILKSLSNRLPENGDVQEAMKNISAPIASIDEKLKTMGEVIFENPDQFGINRKASQQYVDACEAYALANPGDLKSADYLYKAAEIARSLRTFPKTLSIYDWIIESYPKYEKAPTTLFLKGFIIENELQNDDMAREVYEEFVDKYPSHDLADDVKFLLENLGKTNEEILELIEKK